MNKYRKHVFLQRFKAWWKFNFDNHIEPNLYLLALWLCLSAGASIILNDIERGTAAASAFSLYYLITGFYKMNEYKKMLLLAAMDEQNDKSQ